MSAALHGQHQTLRELRASAVQRLREAGIERAEADARILLAFALGIDAATLLASPERPVGADAAAAFESVLARRIAREPVAHIAGEKEFWSLPFAVTRDVLVPRPETETIVEAALAAFPERERAFHMLDLGTGSGALLCAILSERPHARGVGLDKSKAALDVARRNVERLELVQRAELVEGDWSYPFGDNFDLIVSNPPYIASGELALLSPDVRDHDPALALDGGLDGLDAYRAIVNRLGELLTSGGVAVLELGIGQQHAVSALVNTGGRLAVQRTMPDLSGIPRALVIHAIR